MATRDLRATLTSGRFSGDAYVAKDDSEAASEEESRGAYDGIDDPAHIINAGYFTQADIPPPALAGPGGGMPT